MGSSSAGNKRTRLSAVLLRVLKINFNSGLYFHGDVLLCVNRGSASEGVEGKMNKGYSYSYICISIMQLYYFGISLWAKPLYIREKEGEKLGVKWQLEMYTPMRELGIPLVTLKCSRYFDLLVKEGCI